MKSVFVSSPIWLGLLLAFFYPFSGLNLSKFAFFLLLLQGVFNFLTLQFSSLKKTQVFSAEILSKYVIAYLLLPSLQMFISYFLIDDPYILLGLLLASLAPVAIVAPLFLNSEVKQLRSLISVIVSTLGYPVFCFIYLKLYSYESQGLQIAPIIRDSIILAIVPLIFSFVLEILFKSTKQKLVAYTSAYLRWTNMFIIGALVFIFFGSSFSKINYEQVNAIQIVTILFIALVQDFATYGLLKLLKWDEEYAISYSIKNIGLSAGILIIFQPKSVLACSLVFVAHGLIFIFFDYRLKKLKS